MQLILNMLCFDLRAAVLRKFLNLPKVLIRYVILSDSLGAPTFWIKFVSGKDGLVDTLVGCDSSVDLAGEADRINTPSRPTAQWVCE